MEHQFVTPDIDPKTISAPYTYENNTASKHSGIGIASLIISIAAASVLFMFVIMAGVMEVSTPGGINEESIGAVILGMLMLGSMAILFVSLAFGIAGLFQANRKKLFAILGIIISTLALLGTGTLMIAGLMIG